MDERLAKKYAYQLKFLKTLLELLLSLPLLFLMYYGSSLLKLSENNTYISIFNDIQEELIVEFRPIFLPLILLFIVFTLLFWILLPNRNSNNILERYFFKFSKYYALFSGIVFFIVGTLSYFSFVFNISDLDLFGTDTTSEYQKWVNAMTFVSVHYLIVWRVSKIIIEYFLASEISIKINRIFAWMDYDKGYMKVYYKSRMIHHLKKYKYWFAIRFSQHKVIKNKLLLGIYIKVLFLETKYHNWRVVKNSRKYQFLLEDIDNDGRIRREDELLSRLLDKSMRVRVSK